MTSKPKQRKTKPSRRRAPPSHGCRSARKQGDYQRKLVYKCGDDLLRARDWPFLSLSDCKRVIAHIFRFSAAPPVIVFVEISWFPASASQMAIWLPPWARRLPILLHECAHLYWPDHGPEFMRVFIELLERYADVSIFALRKSAIEKGLDIQETLFSKKIPAWPPANPRRRYQ